MNNELAHKKEELIERLGVHIEQKDQIAPLAARIISSLILNGNKGCTFEELVVSLKASKSTVSTHLNALQQASMITYYTVCGDRKKYFTINPNGTIIHMNKMLRNWEEEKQLHEAIMEYKTSMNACTPHGEEHQFDLEYHMEFMNFINQASTTIKRLRDKLSEKSKNN